LGQEPGIGHFRLLEPDLVGWIEIRRAISHGRSRRRTIPQLPRSEASLVNPTRRDQLGHPFTVDLAPGTTPGTRRESLREAIGINPVAHGIDPAEAKGLVQRFADENAQWHVHLATADPVFGRPVMMRFQPGSPFDRARIPGCFIATSGHSSLLG
jgi:hypothetical protein